MSFHPVIKYFGGLAIFGFFFYILDDVVQLMSVASVKDATYDLMLLFWAGSLVIYVIFGGWWLVRMYNEQQYMGGRY